ncbi:MAG TPA: hypothetical protein VF691_04785 [Cytophagaceae bacterium]|jgi:hypothetical protein
MRSILIFIILFARVDLGVAQDKLNYFSHIRPIILKNCAPCHHDGGYAPFALQTYEDIAKRSRSILTVCQKGIMPPWKADTLYQSYANQRGMSQAEIGAISQWISQGMPKGKDKERSLRQIVKGSQLELGPSLTLKMPSAFLIPGNNKHNYGCYKIPYELPNDTFVRGIEFIAQNKTLVHHASYQILAVDEDVDVFDKPYNFLYGDSIKSVSDAHDFNYLKLVGRSGNMPIEVFHSGWLPGTAPLIFPEGIGFRLPKKGVILIRNMHFSPSPQDVNERSSFNLFFSKHKVDRQIQFAAFKPRGVSSVIRADSVKKFFIIIKMNSDMSLLCINPHMHLLGRTFKAFALAPSGDTIPLVNIPDWDFNWQEFYRFKNIVKIPKGSILHAEALFDNTRSNPNNPNFPPKDVYFETGSMEDTEEMMRLVFLFLPYMEGDENVEL